MWVFIGALSVGLAAGLLINRLAAPRLNRLQDTDKQRAATEILWRSQAQLWLSLLTILVVVLVTDRPMPIIGVVTGLLAARAAGLVRLLRARGGERAGE